MNAVECFKKIHELDKEIEGLIRDIQKQQKARDEAHRVLDILQYHLNEKVQEREDLAKQWTYQGEEFYFLPKKAGD